MSRERDMIDYHAIAESSCESLVRRERDVRLSRAVWAIGWGDTIRVWLREYGPLLLSQWIIVLHFISC